MRGREGGRERERKKEIIAKAEVRVQQFNLWPRTSETSRREGGREGREGREG